MNNRISLIQGDCIEQLKTMEDEQFDVVLTDPPYGMNYVTNRRKHPNDIAVPVTSDKSFDHDFHLSWATEAYRVVKTGGAIYSFCSDHHLGEFRLTFSEAGFKVKRLLVWKKNAWTAGDLYGDYGHQTEFIIYATKGRHILSRPRIGNVLEFPRVPAKQLMHSCQKPVPLLQVLLAKSVPSSGSVLDPFMGSGGVAEACLSGSYTFTGIDCEARYVEMTQNRLYGQPNKYWFG